MIWSETTDDKLEPLEPDHCWWLQKVRCMSLQFSNDVTYKTQRYKMQQNTKHLQLTEMWVWSAVVTWLAHLVIYAAHRKHQDNATRFLCQHFSSVSSHFHKSISDQRLARVLTTFLSTEIFPLVCVFDVVIGHRRKLLKVSSKQQLLNIT